METNSYETDFLIVGSGAAGLYAALHASDHGSVTLVTKSKLSESSSYWAQGGIAAVLYHNDTIEDHFNDTYQAGRETGNSEAIRILVEEGPKDVQHLIDLGMLFDQSNGNVELALEGGHSQKRILHSNGASTGKALIDFLSGLVENKKQIKVIENAFVYQLISDSSDGSCRGADLFLIDQKQQLRILSNSVILATGGYSGLYGRSTNPHTSIGDGLWLALRSGAYLKDLEFIQFHPTAFYASDHEPFLISEALRGAGAYLRNSKGERFMDHYPEKELAPRDIVAQEIYNQLESSGDMCVQLDMRHLDQKYLREKYKGLIQAIEDKGINISRQCIPVAPAAHYCIGGIKTDLFGQTNVSRLYACGEVAATGVHGANRLASNSLLECLVFGRRAAVHAAQNYRAVNLQIKKPVEAPLKPLKIDRGIEKKYVETRTTVSELLNRYAGILRNKTGLISALDQIESMKMKIKPVSNQNEYYSLRRNGLLTIAGLILESSLAREKSIGVHARSDENLTEITMDQDEAKL